MQDRAEEPQNWPASHERRLGHIEATLSALHQSVDDIRRELHVVRSGGVNWLGILGLIVSVLFPILGGVGVLVVVQLQGPQLWLELHEKRLDAHAEAVGEAYSRIASLEKADERSLADRQAFQRHIDDTHDRAAADLHDAERQLVEQLVEDQRRLADRLDHVTRSATAAETISRNGYHEGS